MRPTGRPAQRPIRSPAPHATVDGGGATSLSDPLARPQVFGRGHVGDWCAAALLLAVPAATGADLWRQLGWDSEAGRLLMLGLALLGMGAAGLYVAARIAVWVRVAPSGIAAVRGPWRRELRWEEIARLRERTETVDGRPMRWLVAQAHDGRRLQVHEDVVADYPRLRATVFAAQQRWRALGEMGTEAEAGHSGVYGPLYLARETPRATGLLVVPALACAGVAVYLWALIVPLRVVALGLGVAALGLGAVGLRARLGRRSYAFDDAGVEAWSRFPAVRLDWRDLTHATHRRPWMSGLIWLAGWASDGLYELAVGQAAWSGDTRWPRRAPEVLLLRGGGRRLALPLHRLRDPDAVVARVERGIQAARQTARLPVVSAEPGAEPGARPTRGRITTRLPAVPAPDTMPDTMPDMRSGAESAANTPSLAAEDSTTSGAEARGSAEPQ